MVDESDASLYVAGSTGAVAIRSGRTGTLDLRFNLPAMGFVTPREEDEQSIVSHCVALRAKLRDTGANSRVIVRLVEVNLWEHDMWRPPMGVADPNRPNTRILGTIDSEFTQNGAPRQMASPNYFLFAECMNLPNDFQFSNGQFAYFIEAQLVKTSSTANPGLMMVGICNRSAGCEDN
jgi:hypothetical protein